ncbi:MAG: DNRLRE domain-containing protein [Candidatus Zixiibacteriota bacterium]
MPSTNDAIVISGATADMNFGSTGDIGIVNTQGVQAESYIFFNINSIPPVDIDRATLSLWVETANSPGNQTVCRVTGGWSEFGVTWNNRPGKSNPCYTALPFSFVDTYRGIVVTDIVQYWLDNGDNFGFNISIALGEVSFTSRQGVLGTSSHAPKLFILYKQF